MKIYRAHHKKRRAVATQMGPAPVSKANQLAANLSTNVSDCLTSVTCTSNPLWRKLVMVRDQRFRRGGAQMGGRGLRDTESLRDRGLELEFPSKMDGYTACFFFEIC